jgi:hypothetical protein
MMVKGEYWPEPGNWGSLPLSSSAGGGGLAKSSARKAPSATSTAPSTGKIRGERAELWVCNFISIPKATPELMPAAQVTGILLVHINQHVD